MAGMLHRLQLAQSTLPAQATRLIAGALAQPQRYILGIAGLPAAGKSTLAQRLFDAIEAKEPGFAALVPMDGFHLCNRELDARGLRPFKGAPQTFDAAAYISLLERLRSPVVCEVVPMYDRALHDPRPGDAPQHHVTATTRLLITEGNYLLLDQSPWDTLANLLDETWWLDTSDDTAQQRMIDRHIRGGRSPQDARAHVQRSDADNMALVQRCQRTPTAVVTWLDASDSA